MGFLSHYFFGRIHVQKFHINIYNINGHINKFHINTIENINEVMEFQRNCEQNSNYFVEYFVFLNPKLILRCMMIFEQLPKAFLSKSPAQSFPKTFHALSVTF